MFSSILPENIDEMQLEGLPLYARKHFVNAGNHHGGAKRNPNHYGWGFDFSWFI